MTRYETKRLIMESAVDLAKKYNRAEPSEVGDLVTEFSQKLNVILKIK